jgi:hypothetical protein
MKKMSIFNHKGNANQSIFIFHFNPLRMAIIWKQKSTNAVWQGCRSWGRILIYCWWECKLDYPLWKSVERFLNKLKIELPYDPAVALLAIYPKDSKAAYNRDTNIPILIMALFTIAKLWNYPRCPSTDTWIKKMWCIYYT